jgi:uncharacterized membrane protein
MEYRNHNHDFLPPPLGRLPSGGDRRRRRAAAAGEAFTSVRAQHAARRTDAQVFADRLTQLASRPLFLFVHVAIFALWIAWNVGLLGARPFDPFPFGLLTLALSIEAIVLTCFVLMSQGRDAAIAELREEITLQVTLRVEEEVTKTLQLVAGLYARLGLSLGDDDDLQQMLEPLNPQQIEQEMQAQISPPGKPKVR